MGVFLVICLLHSTIAILAGSLMMFYTQQVYTFNHGIEATLKLLGSTPHDQLLIRTSDSFSGLLLFAIGLLMFMVAFVEDGDFQSFFAKGCVALHLAMCLWRVWFGRNVEGLAWDWARQSIGDVVLALSWVFFQYYNLYTYIIESGRWHRQTNIILRLPPTLPLIELLSSSQQSASRSRSGRIPELGPAPHSS